MADHTPAIDDKRIIGRISQNSMKPAVAKDDTICEICAKLSPHETNTKAPGYYSAETQNKAQPAQSQGLIPTWRQDRRYCSNTQLPTCISTRDQMSSSAPAILSSAVKGFLGLLDNQIGRVTRKFMEQGYSIAATNLVASAGFGSADSFLMKAITGDSELVKEQHSLEPPGKEFPNGFMHSFQAAQGLSNETFNIVLQRIGDPNALPFIHVTLIFMYRLSRHSDLLGQAELPWNTLAVMLNTLLVTSKHSNTIEDDVFPMPNEGADARPFPEDYALRGLLWADNYFPENWFTNEKIDEEEKYHERSSMAEQRKERIFWLCCRLARVDFGISYQREDRRFTCGDFTADLSKPPDRSTGGGLSLKIKNLLARSISGFARSWVTNRFHYAKKIPRIVSHLRLSMRT